MDPIDFGRGCEAHLVPQTNRRMPPPRGEATSARCMQQPNRTEEPSKVPTLVWEWGLRPCSCSRECWGRCSPPMRPHRHGPSRAPLLPSAPVGTHERLRAHLGAHFPQVPHLPHRLCGDRLRRDARDARHACARRTRAGLALARVLSHRRPAAPHHNSVVSCSAACVARFLPCASASPSPSECGGRRRQAWTRTRRYAYVMMRPAQAEDVGAMADARCVRL
jgi:hypothetical protein